VRKEACDSVAGEINKKGGEAIPVVTNVLEKESLEKAKNEILKKFKKVDILINGAGGNKKEATTSEKLLHPRRVQGQLPIQSLSSTPIGEWETTEGF
jgi:NADP-dependent 3-hydroxy acid dehydrogenase YdfG